MAIFGGGLTAEKCSYDIKMELAKSCVGYFDSSTKLYCRMFLSVGVYIYIYEVMWCKRMLHL